MAAVTDAVQQRQAQVRALITDLTERGRVATGELSERVTSLAEDVRGRVEAVPAALLDELRRRLNVLDLASKTDLQVQSQLGRSRVSTVLKEFLVEQREREAELLDALRTEFRDELQSLTAAIQDDMFAIETPARPDPADALTALLDEMEEEDDLDLVSLDEIDASDDGELDALDGTY
jgi:hypothetical protein